MHTDTKKLRVIEQEAMTTAEFEDAVNNATEELELKRAYICNVTVKQYGEHNQKLRGIIVYSI